MRLVVDTNILVSALLAGTSLPAQLILLWRQGRFELLTAAEQLDELRRVTGIQRSASVWRRRSPGAWSTTCARSPSP